jgi:hypothetical protein
MRETPQQFVATVVVDNGLTDHRAKARHAIPKPSRYMPAVQRQIGAAGPAGHFDSLLMHRT